MGIHSHLLLMVTFTFLVALVGGVLVGDTPGRQWRSGAVTFAGLIGGAIVVGWVLYLLPL
jgi:hypothetical protein